MQNLKIALLTDELIQVLNKYEVVALATKTLIVSDILNNLKTETNKAIAIEKAEQECENDVCKNDMG